MERTTRQCEAARQGKPSRLNREWHLANRMPKNPSLKERARWHFEHERHCQCRTMTKKLRETLTKALK